MLAVVVTQHPFHHGGVSGVACLVQHGGHVTSRNVCCTEHLARERTGAEDEVWVHCLELGSQRMQLHEECIHGLTWLARQLLPVGVDLIASLVRELFMTPIKD